MIQPLRITTSWTHLQVRHALQTTPELQAAIAFDGDSGRLYFNVNSTEQARRTDVPQWWRIRAVDSMHIEALVSADGVVWESWHIANVAVPDSINVDYSAGIYGTPGIAGTATFSAFGLCN